MAIDVLTFGCRLNAHESEIVRLHADAAGLKDAVIVNTCAVTGEALRQARQTVRRLRRERPGARIVVTGCGAQTDPAAFASMPEVDRVLGNGEKLDPRAWARTAALFDAAGAFGIDGDQKVAVNDVMSIRETALHLIDGFGDRSRAFVQVQNGCDHRCTFCIIPFARGASRSVPMGEVVSQVRRLVGNGYREVVLTGVDMTSYGTNLPGAPRLGVLVKQILKHVPELDRLRLSSIDAAEADADLLDAVADAPRLMPHFHLSLQAGDDLILKRMRRRHRRGNAAAFCETIRQLRPDVVFGADLIAGFPTETEDMFRRSLDLVDECDLVHLHVFPYSARPGTPAARMPPVPREVVRDRARRLRDKGRIALARRLAGEVGARRRVLAEADDRGRTEHFLEVRLTRRVEPGSIAEVTVSGHDGRRLIAE